MNRLSLIFLTALYLLAACKPTPPPTRILSASEYEDKLKAAWIGQMVGVGRGAVTEFKWIGELIPEEKIPAWEPEMVNQYGQDDLYVEMTFMENMQKHGIDVNIRQAGIDFANSAYGLACANDRGRENLREGIAPPASSHPHYNVNCEDIDYQIEADYAGIIAPGMPQVPIYLGEKFGRLMNYGDGMYAGQFVGGMYSAAYFETDIKKIIDKGLECIPDSSAYSACMRDVIGWYNDNPNDWKGTWKKIVDKYYNTLDHQPYHKATPKAWAGVSAKLNGAFIVLGLLYGHGDIDSTFCISVASGFDSDCNPSSALGILFASKGLENIPSTYYSALDTTQKFSHTNYTFPELLNVSKQLMLQFLKKEGGKVEKGSDDQEYFIIPVKKPIPSQLEQSWAPLPLDTATARFTETEMSQIEYLPSKALNNALQKFAPGWMISNSTKKTAIPELVSFLNRDNVLQMTYGENEGATIRYELMVPDKGSPELKLDVANDPGKTWKLTIRFSWQPVYEAEINDALTKKDWHKITRSLSEYKGKKLFIHIEGSKGTREESKVYISNLIIK